MTLTVAIANNLIVRRVAVRPPTPYNCYMCGIAGQFLRDRTAELTTVRSMCDQIRHRGPDDEGFHVDGGCGIGMRRLSIIDLSTGHQPISNEDGSVWGVFNGEIYSYQETRRDLIS